MKKEDVWNDGNQTLQNEKIVGNLSENPLKTEGLKKSQCASLDKSRSF